MKYLIDCGGHHGEGLMHFIKKYNVDKTWKIFTFEPNKKSFDVLKNLQINDLEIEKINAGIWISDSETVFRPETTHKIHGKNDDGAGSTFINSNDWNIKAPANWGAGDYITSYAVKVINFSNFLKTLESPEFIFVKMDIEGCEYQVLRKLINDGTISLISEMECEFHHWAMKSESEETTKELIKKIQNSGVKINKWG